MDAEFTQSQQWVDAEARFLLFEPKSKDDPSSGYILNSFSGHERNRLFLGSDGNFTDATTVSGADFREDGRGFVLFDFDQDGWIDVGVSSAQQPRFRLLRNQIGDSSTDGRSVSLRLEGAHRGKESQTQWSSRDPIGAELIVNIGETRKAFRLSAGEGLSSQNSKWIHVGLGTADKIDKIEVAWPSGKRTIHEHIAAGERVTLYEKSEQNVDGVGRTE